MKTERAASEKIKYARKKAIGGLIIWELGGGYRSDKPEDQRDLLLQAIKKELAKNYNG